MVTKKRRPNRSARVPDVDGAVLLTAAATRGNGYGTGFCIDSSPQGAVVVTASHVVRDIDAEGGGLYINGHKASLLASGDGQGLDLAVLNVPGLQLSPLELANELPTALSRFIGVAYQHLAQDQYVSVRMQGEVIETQLIREKTSQVSGTLLALRVTEGSVFTRGNSGAPICNPQGRVIGVLAYASKDGNIGYAYATTTLRSFLSGSPTTARTLGTERTAGPRPLPPELPDKDKDDTQKNRFGGSTTDGTAVLTAVIKEVYGRKLFIFDAMVNPASDSTQLLPPAKFYLHDTFPRSPISIKKPNALGGFTLEDIHASGAFTLGCIVFASDGHWHTVEFDLMNLPGLPEAFRKR